MQRYRTLIAHFAERRASEPPGLAFATLSTDEESDAALRATIGPGVRLFATRVAYEDEGPEGDSFAVRNGFAGMVATLPPSDSYSAFAFACTAAVVSMTRDRFLAELAAALPGKPITAPAIAASAVCGATGMRQIALLTPYPRKLHERLVGFFSDDGIRVLQSASFELNDDAAITSISEAAILTAARDLCEAARPQALFVSCGAFRVVQLLPRLASAVGVPVFSSIQALAWHARTLLGVPGAGPVVLP